jgi:hypothetical protein
MSNSADFFVLMRICKLREDPDSGPGTMVEWLISMTGDMSDFLSFKDSDVVWVFQ